MPVKIGTLLTNLAQKFGIPTDSTDFIDLLAANLEIPDSIANAFKADLLTFEAAKNNPKLQAHYYATSLNEVDRRLQGNMTELDFPESMRADVLTAQSTFDRLDLFGRKMKELIAQREGSKGQEKNQLTDQINTLQARISAEQQTYAQQLQAMQQAHSSELSDLYLSNRIASKRLDTTKFPTEVMQGIARNFVDQAITQKGIKPVYSNKAISLKQAVSPELDYYQDNRPYTIDQLIDEVLAANKLLVVTDPAPPTTPGSNGNQPQQYPPRTHMPGTPQQTAQQPLNGMLAKLDRVMGDLSKVDGSATF
jgi:hypothetical protein